MSKIDCLIIGGGAAGLMCACSLFYFSQCENKKLNIVIAEGTERVGNKLLLTGNGRANLTNENITSEKYCTDSALVLEKVFEEFSKDELLSFLGDELGILTSCDDSLYYPYTYRSNTVLDAFRLYLSENGVEILSDYKANAIKAMDDGYHVFFLNGQELVSDRVVVACGGMSYPKTGSDGSGYKLLLPFISPEDFIKPLPSLVRFNVSDKDIKGLKGIRSKVKVSLYSDRRRKELVASETGEMLFTENGVSGICVMQLSQAYNAILRRTGRKPVLSVNFLGLLDDIASDIICSNLLQFAERTVTDSLLGLIRPAILNIVLDRAGIQRDRKCFELSPKEISGLIKEITQFDLTISGTDGFSDAQVTSGGVALGACNENLMLGNHDGLYLIGEILNVDGLCGGYNLTWAFCSAMKCAKAISDEYRRE